MECIVKTTPDINLDKASDLSGHQPKCLQYTSLRLYHMLEIFPAFSYQNTINEQVKMKSCTGSVFSGVTVYF